MTTNVATFRRGEFTIHLGRPIGDTGKFGRACDKGAYGDAPQPVARPDEAITCPRCAKLAAGR